jgi:hypothetical protein
MLIGRQGVNCRTLAICETASQLTPLSSPCPEVKVDLLHLGKKQRMIIMQNSLNANFLSRYCSIHYCCYVQIVKKNSIK